jgi:hypothetical protein
MSDLKTLSEKAKHYEEQYKAGKLSSSQFKELIDDLNITNNIRTLAKGLAEEEKYRSILVGVLDVASSIV